MMLFTEYQYFEYKFPRPQYLGAKYLLRSWLQQFIPQDIHVVCDAFAGSQSMAFLFKQLGFKVITNDFLNFSHQIGLALIVNKDVILDKQDWELLLEPNPDPGYYNLLEEIYANIFFTQEQARVIDAIRGNIDRLANEFKRALALAILNRSLTRKVTMGHFAHQQALNYANNPERIKRNRSLIRPIQEIMSDILTEYNQAIFDNGQENLSYNLDALELLPQLQNVDLLYLDPPYCNSHADYQSFYHLLETNSMYWKDKEFINGTRRYSPKRYSGFDKKTAVLSSLQKLFAVADSVPHWLISYNDRSYPDIESLCGLISQYRPFRVERKEYLNDRGGRGSVAGSHEVAIIASKDKDL